MGIIKKKGDILLSKRYLFPETDLKIGFADRFMIMGRKTPFEVISTKMVWKLPFFHPFMGISCYEEEIVVALPMAPSRSAILYRDCLLRRDGKNVMECFVRNKVLCRKGKRLFLLFLFLSAACVSHGQEDTIGVRIYFHPSETDFIAGYRDNGKRVQQFVERFRSILPDSNYHVSSLEVISGASPEGYHSQNLRLSQDRANALISYLQERLPLSGLTTHVRSLGSDWVGCERLVMDSDIPNKEEVLRIIRSVPDLRGTNTDPRLTALRRVGGGESWRYLQQHIFPELRESGVEVSFRYKRKDTADERVDQIMPGKTYVVDTLIQMVGIHDTVFIIKDRCRERRDSLKNRPHKDSERYQKLPTDKMLVLAPRTNLLLPLLNIGVEVPIGNRWSVALDHYYPWWWRRWGGQSHRNCFELMFESVEARYWIGSRHKNEGTNYRYRLSGHSLAVFGTGGYYDFERDWTGRQGEFWGAGVDYLWALPGRKGRVRWEFELGVGFLHSSARRYDVFEDGGKLFKRKGVTETTTWIGPLKASVSLVVPIYKKMKTENRKEGGAL